MSEYKPMGGKKIYDSLKEEKCIIMAVNLRMPKGVVDGIFRAAKDTQSPIIFELAKSESNLEGGYTGQTPEIYAKVIKEAARKAEYGKYAIHADHIGIKTGEDNEIEDVKKLVAEQIKQGYTSFAIDASHIFNFDGKNAAEELEGNIKATAKIAKFIEENYPGDDFGLEVEVGEIGKEDENGRVLTTPQEAVTYIKELNKLNVYPQILAIANGSAHGNTYKDGSLVEQISVDIPQTKKIVNALKENDLKVRIAQHGITGTPRDMIANCFPKGDILKGNVGTFWQNLVLDIYKVFEPELYKLMWDWTLDKYAQDGKSDEEIFGKKVKLAIKVFYDKINNVSPQTTKAIEALAYAESMIFFKCFNSIGAAKKL
jgi:fructose-bisphosphate aldolase, class II